MLILTILACSTSPVRPEWLSVCAADGPWVTCVNADSVTHTPDDKIICHWDCAEIGGEAPPDSGVPVDAYTTGLDLVFQLNADGVCYQVHANRFTDRCPAD